MWNHLLMSAKCLVEHLEVVALVENKSVKINALILSILFMDNVILNIYGVIFVFAMFVAALFTLDIYILYYLHCVVFCYFSVLVSFWQ